LPFASRVSGAIKAYVPSVPQTVSEFSVIAATPKSPIHAFQFSSTKIFYGLISL